MKNNIIIIILVIVIGAVAFWYLGQNNNNTGSSLSVDAQTSNSADAQYIYNILQQMAQVKLDDSIFSDPNFQSLRDNTATFPLQSAGRNNPFAPTGTDTAAPGQTQTATSSPAVKN
jgi:hypothetical protein